MRTILLCRRSIEPCSGKWTLPAGYLENGETASLGFGYVLDEDWTVEAFAQWLDSEHDDAGFDVWLDVRQIKGGEAWRDAIDPCVPRCDDLVVEVEGNKT